MFNFDDSFVFRVFFWSSKWKAHQDNTEHGGGIELLFWQHLHDSGTKADPAAGLPGWRDKAIHVESNDKAMDYNG